MEDDLMRGEFYGDGARRLQDQFDSRRLADRLVDLTLHAALDDGDKALIADQAFFFLSTVDAEGWPDVSFKGGERGLVRVVDASTLRFCAFDGNGMFRSLGNIEDNGRVALLFVDVAKPWRLRVHGTAEVSTDADLLAEFHGATAVVTVTVRRAFPNCGRYVKAMRPEAIDEYVPRPGHEPPVPEWKLIRELAEVLPEE